MDSKTNNRTNIIYNKLDHPKKLHIPIKKNEQKGDNMTEELFYQVIDKNDKRIDELEKIRGEAFHLIPNSFYKNQIQKDKILAIACFYKEELIAGIYLSSSMKSLFIEAIFVKEKYQNNHLHIGHSLLKYTLEHKFIAEEFFKEKFTTCRLESRGRDTFYKYLGFQEENNILETMKKRI